MFIHTSLWLLVLSSIVQGHVRLVYPPARKYDFDALDNIDGEPPCGMPRGFGPVTILEEGSDVSMVWDMAWTGPASLRPLLNYTIQLLDASDRIVATLARAKFFAKYGDDIPVMARVVTLPQYVIGNYFTLRLSSMLPENITFWTCADVNVVPLGQLKLIYSGDYCSKHGTFDNATSTCRCEYLYSGERCQFLDECWKDGDCGEGRGKCIDTGMIGSYPRMQCYCHWGYFGTECGQESTVKNPMYNPDKYRIFHLGRWLTLFWRVLHRNPAQGRFQDEIEMILRSVGESYVALGWRPKGLTVKCQEFPRLPSGSYGADTGTVNSNDHKSTPSRSGKKKRRRKTRWSKTHPLHPMACTDMVIGAAKGNLTRVFDYYSWDMATPRADEFFGGRDDLTAAVGHEDDGVTTILFRKRLAATDDADHSIHNTAMHVIWAVGRAFYHSLYQPDLIKYHGVSAERRGMTLLNFFSSEYELNEACYDNNCHNHATCYGLSRKNFICVCPQGFTGSTCDQVLDPCDYLNCRNGGTCVADDSDDAHCVCAEGYIGVECEFRTVSTALRSVNVSTTRCSGSFHYPPECTDNDCVYRASWVYNETIEFLIEAKTYGKTWTGIGFNKRPSMLNADVIVGWVSGGEVHVSSVTDRHVSMFYMKPEIDEQMDYYFNGIYNIHNSLIDGITKIKFSRDLKTWDKQDFWFDEDCAYFLFPVYGGIFDLMTDYIGEHSEIPLISSEKICISSCKEVTEEVPIRKIPEVTAEEAPLGVSGACNLTNSTFIGNETVGEIWSPNYPVDDYPNSLDCLWTVRVDKEKYIKLSFIDFYTEPSHDYVEIISHNSQYSNRKFSGFNYPISLISDGPEMQLRFVTDKFLTKSGFKLLYESVNSNIKEELKAPYSHVQQICYSRTYGGIHPYIPPTYTVRSSDMNQGTITSPGFPFALPRDLDCRWIITSSTVAITGLIGDLPSGTMVMLFEGSCRDFQTSDDLPCKPLFTYTESFAHEPTSSLYDSVTMRLLTNKEYGGKSYSDISGMIGFQMKYEIARHITTAKIVETYDEAKLTLGQWAGVAIAIMIAVILFVMTGYGFHACFKRKRLRCSGSAPITGGIESQLEHHATHAVEAPPAYREAVDDESVQTEAQGTGSAVNIKLPSYDEVLAMGVSSTSGEVSEDAESKNEELSSALCSPSSATTAIVDSSDDDNDDDNVAGASHQGANVTASPMLNSQKCMNVVNIPPSPPSILKAGRYVLPRPKSSGKKVRIDTPSSDTNCETNRIASSTGAGQSRQLSKPNPPLRNDSLAYSSFSASSDEAEVYTNSNMANFEDNCYENLDDYDMVDYDTAHYDGCYDNDCCESDHENMYEDIDVQRL